MNTYPIIMALMGQYPLKLSTTNDPSISCNLLQYDDTKQLVSVEMDKVVSSQNVTINIQGGDARYEYDCVIDGPSDCTKTNLKIKTVKVTENHETIVCKSDVSVTINADKELEEFPIEGAANPMCFAVVNASKQSVFVKVNSSDQASVFTIGKHLNLNVGAICVQSSKVLDVEEWGSNMLRLTLNDFNSEVLTQMSKNQVEMSTFVGIEWDFLVKTGALKV